MAGPDLTEPDIWEQDGANLLISPYHGQGLQFLAGETYALTSPPGANLVDAHAGLFVVFDELDLDGGVRSDDACHRQPQSTTSQYSMTVASRWV